MSDLEKEAEAAARHRNTYALLNPEITHSDTFVDGAKFAREKMLEKCGQGPNK